MAQMVERLHTLELEEEEFTPAPAANGRLQDAAESMGLTMGKSVAQIRDFGQHLRGHAEFIKQEKPLQLLGILAGIALAAGFATRVWRSTRNA